MISFTNEPIMKLIKDGQDVRLIGADTAPVEVLCFHGGGGVGGAPEMMDGFASHLTQDDHIRMAVARYRVLNTAPDATLQDMFDDARDALAWSRANLNGGELWVLGASFGALLALDAVLESPQGVAGLILLNPVTHTGVGGFSNRVVDPAQHSAQSPLTRYKDHPVLSQLRCLVVHGVDDDVVPIQSSRDFAALWPQERSKMIELPNATHGFFNRSPRDAETSAHVKGFVGAGVATGKKKKKAATLPKDVRLLCCVGGQKAGTSWLFDQMSKSPQVHTRSVKEWHYFDVLWKNDGHAFLDPKINGVKDLAKQLQTGSAPRNGVLLRKISQMAEQLAPFAAEADDHSAYIAALNKNRSDEPVVCDFTPSYCGLTAKHFAQIDALGDVRFVYILRDPVARMWSQIRMKFTTLGVENIAAECAAHAHKMCDDGRMGTIFRADYASTLAALDEGAKKVEILFYEDLFEQATFDRIASFVGIDPVQIDSQTKVNEGLSVPLPPELEQRMLHALAPQYEAVMARFQGDVPAVWQDRFSRYVGSPAQQRGQTAVQSVQRTSDMLKKLKAKISPSLKAAQMPQVVFLHIPKTAGQSIVQELRRVFGGSNMSPVRTHTQAKKDAQLPAGYRVYAGHIDWVDLEGLEDKRFSFSVLRNPRERIASFYFYLKREAEMLSAEQLALNENTGKRNILTMSADEYFFGGQRPWQIFIHDHYDNFYTTYFATRRIRGWHLIKDLTPDELMMRAIAGAQSVSGIYGISELDRLETDLSTVLDATLNLQSTRVNTGPPPQSGKRWDDLMGLFDREESKQRIEDFVVQDEAFMREIGREAELQ